MTLALCVQRLGRQARLRTHVFELGIRLRDDGLERLFDFLGEVSHASSERERSAYFQSHLPRETEAELTIKFGLRERQLGLRRCESLIGNVRDA
jgi:hypothetical protein